MLFKNAKILREDCSVASDKAVLVENEMILEVGDSATLQRKHTGESHDCKGKLIMPGLVCAHTHIYSAFARGMSVKGPLTDFPSILKNLWWKLDSVLDSEAVKYSALVSFIEGIKHGTTAYFDHHASPRYITGSLETIAEVAKNLGVRANLSYEITDRYGEAKALEAIEENERFLKRQDAMCSATIGIHASFTVSDATLEKVRELKEKTNAGIHIHLAEDRVDEEDAIAKYGMDVVSRLEKFGLLDDKALCVHAIHVSKEEIERLRRVKANIIHCPESNMNNAVGVANIPYMLEQGLNVFLGTDGFTHDMFTEAKVCHILHKLANSKPYEMPASKVWEMLWNNTQLASKFFGIPMGRISKGFAADFIILDYKNYTRLSQANFPWHFIFGMDATCLSEVVVNGRIILSNGKIEGIDEEEVIEKSIKISEEIWEEVIK